MEAYRIGQLIKEFRMRNDVSQEELSFDLCAVSTLSRIESGEQIPSRKLVEAIFSKLGFDVPASEMTDMEFERWQIEHIVIEKINSSDFEIIPLLDKYSQLGEMNEFETQFVNFYKILYDESKSCDIEKIVERKKSALKLTAESFNFQNILSNTKLFTSIELEILESIAIDLRTLGDNVNARKLQIMLKSYFEKRISSEIFNNRNYINCLFELSTLELDFNSFKTSLEYSEMGIQHCIRTGSLNHFDDLFFINAFSLCNLNDKKKGESQFEKAFILMKHMRNSKLPDLISKVNKEFGFNFEI